HLDRLVEFYEKNARLGEPRIQVLLIPSWGMNIAGGAIAGVRNAPIFNVDGPVGSDPGVLGAPSFFCPRHPNDKKQVRGSCAQTDFYECLDHGHYDFNDPTCAFCQAQMQQVVLNLECPDPHVALSDIVPCSCGNAAMRAIFYCFDCKRESRRA